MTTEAKTVTAGSNLQALKDAGYQKLEIEFDGGGDSGSISSFTGFRVDATQAEHVLAHGKAKWDDLREEDYQPLLDLLLDKIPIDWYNDDGGYGMINVDVLTGHVELEANERVTDIVQHNNEFDILASGDEDE